MHRDYLKVQELHGAVENQLNTQKQSSKEESYISLIRE